MAARRPKAGKTTFSNKEIEAITESDTGIVLREASGIAGTVRVTTNGVSIDWAWRYRFAGKVRELRLGSWPKKSMTEIRQGRDEARRILDEEKDPAIERQAEKLEAKLAQQATVTALTEQIGRATVKDLFDRWVNLELSQRKESSRAEVVRSFNKDVLPRIGRIHAEDVTKAHVMAVLDAILERGARRLANRTLSELRQMFGFGYVRDIVKHDPTHRIRKADIGGKETERKRSLSQDEIRELAGKIVGARLHPATECAIWILLSTGCRIGDLMKATWDEIDFAAKTWVFEPEKDQRHIERVHTVFLSDFSIHWFEELQRINGSHPWLYPNRECNGPVCKKSVTKQIGDRQRTESLKNRSKHTGALLLSGGPWIPHDLRRTCGTQMSKLGVSDKVADLCIYHLEPNRMKRIYIRDDMLDAMRDAWRLLGDRLDLLTRKDADNVVTMPIAKAA